MKTKSKSMRRHPRRSTPRTTSSGTGTSTSTSRRQTSSSTHFSNKDERQILDAASQPNERRPQSEGEEVDSDESDDDDEHLLQAAAAAWASTAEASKDNNDNTTPPFSSSSAQHQDNSNDEATTAVAAPPPPCSVHITQISFQANQLDLHRHFATHGGCMVSSVRLVYDKGLDRQRQFRGVAFIDLADFDSYQKALELDKSILMGRKINVRPTKSTQELSNIVQTTQQLIATKIRSSKDQSNGTTRKDVPLKRAHKATKPRNRESDQKLTKKERNKRAAILRQQKKKG